MEKKPEYEMYLNVMVNVKSKVTLYLFRVSDLSPPQNFDQEVLSDSSRIWRATYYLCSVNFDIVLITQQTLQYES